MSSKPAAPQPYDAISRLYDPWSRSVVEDVQFYVEEARKAAPGPVVELGVGTGRIAIPIAAEGIRVIGVDSSAGMLDVCREQASLAGVELDLRPGDFRNPPVPERVPLVLCPFRAYLHLHTDSERLEALQAARELLVPGGCLVFDVFEPDPEDIAETHGRWIEREPGIFEHAEWNARERRFTLSVRGPGEATTMSLSWLEHGEWQRLLEKAGFVVADCYGWFDRRPWAGEADSVWIVRRPHVG